MSKAYSFTTPIYYVNAAPHLGTAYTTIAADCVARYQRANGKKVSFVTGMDEHGQKVADTAKAHDMVPQAWCDSMEPAFREEWEKLKITYTDFVRTTEPRHAKAVQMFWDKLYKAGFLYKGAYEGWYCVHEETYYAKSDLDKSEDGQLLCPECGRPVIEASGEENWFFKLSEFEKPLLDYIESHPNFIRPQIRKNEVISFIKSGLKDLSISRSTFDWGVPLPFDKGHVAYVWADALIAYLTGIGFCDDSRQEEFSSAWPMQYHFVGKDIIRFHCVIWPAMLMAADMPLPKCIFGHGFLLTKGEKMSKSKGNAVSPDDIKNVFGLDGYRYYFMSDVNFGMDGSISLERMVQVYNSDLANTWGNLVSRVLNMTKKYFDCKIPTPTQTSPMKDLVDAIYKKYDSAMSIVDFSTALKYPLELAERVNQYVEETAPWTLAKSGDIDKLSEVMYNMIESIRIIAMYFAPFMPDSSETVLNSLGINNVENIKDASVWGIAKSGTVISIPKNLFPRLKESEINFNID